MLNKNLINIITIEPTHLILKINKKMSYKQLLAFFYCSIHREKHFCCIHKGAEINNPSTQLEEGYYEFYFELPNLSIPKSTTFPHIVYEDEICLIANKPSYLLVHNDGNNRDNLQEQVNIHLYQNGWPYQSQAIHRIDYQTSGLVLFSKFPFFQGLFDEIISTHAIEKKYYALLQGNVAFKTKTIQLPIGKDRHINNKMRIHTKGKEATTHLKKIKNFSTSCLVEANIETGRKHQIRVHCQAIGHPIINDPIYGTIQDQRGLMLQNHYLKFKHPITEEYICVDIPVDPRFKTKSL